MFVNTSGNLDGNIPADLQMEFLVRVYQKHIKHMMSNKSEENIARRVNSLAGMHEIVQNFDAITVNSVRTNKHSTAANRRTNLLYLVIYDSVSHLRTLLKGN